eukprot:1160226-Pelagomonas_calceolata.AAC.3
MVARDDFEGTWNKREGRTNQHIGPRDDKTAIVNELSGRALASTNRGGRPLWTSWLTGGRGKEERGALLGDACSVLSRSPGMWREMHGIGA